MTTASSSPPKRQVGGFELLDKIGQGGMGAVFKARQISLDRIVAVKLLPPKIAQKDPVFIDRFFREARSSAKLNHPNIVQGIDVGYDETHKLYFFAMEFVDGPTCKVLLQEQKVIPERKALEIVKGVAQALVCAHRAGIVHRDVKPDNILLTSRGEPKLADLGLARFVLDAADEGGDDEKHINDAELTQAGMAIGTPSYMSPEQVKGLSDIVDARSDLYALGATLYHMVTGRPPFVAEKVQQVLAMHLTVPPPYARSTNPAVSDDTSKLIVRLMQKEQVERVQTAEQLDQEIARISNAIENRVTGRRSPIGPGGRPIPTGGHKPVTTGGHRPIGTGGQRPITTAGHKPVGDESRRSDRQEQAAAKRKPIVLIGAGVAALVVIGILALVLTSGPKPTDVAENRPDPVSPVMPSPAPNPSPVPANPTPDPNKVTTPGDTPTWMKADPKQENLPKWPPLEKAVEFVQQHPGQYISALRMFAEAEKGAPPEMIAEIRHQRGKVEREQVNAGKTLLEEKVKKANDMAAQKAFGEALAALREDSVPPEMLGEFVIYQLGKLRTDLEQKALDEYLKTKEADLHSELRDAGRDLVRLAALDGKLAAAAEKFGGKPVLDELEVLRRRARGQVKLANAEIIRQQEASFRKLVENCLQLTAAGRLQDAEGELARNKAPGDLGKKQELLAADVKAIREHLKRAVDALVAKINTPAEVTLRVSGVTRTGKIIGQKTDDGTTLFTMQDKHEMTAQIDVSKLDPPDLLSLVEIGSQTPEGRFAAGICYFWQNKPGKAYDTFAQIKKEESAYEHGRAQFYLEWLDDKVEGLAGRIRELFNEYNGGKLSAEDAKARWSEAHGILQRLRTEYAEAYRAFRKR